MDGKAWLDALLDDAFVTLHLRVPEREVVFVKGILEASEGLAAVFAAPRAAGRDDGAVHDGGALVISAPRSREAELLCALADIEGEIAARGGSVLRERRGALRLPG